MPTVLAAIDLEQEIIKLKGKMNAVILAHYYQDSEIQDLADFVGDSLQLSQKAAGVSAEVIVFCGVLFMAETAKILNPQKLVLLPNLAAGCSLAPDHLRFRASIELPRFCRLVGRLPKHRHRLHYFR